MPLAFDAFLLRSGYCRSLLLFHWRNWGSLEPSNDNFTDLLEFRGNPNSVTPSLILGLLNFF